MAMASMRVLLIRNAAFSDFGGGERFPVFLAESLEKNGIEAIIISRSAKLIDYAKSKSLKTIRGLWWQRQNWSGYRVLLTPVYLIWQIILFLWYLQLFIKRRPSVVHVQSKDDFIAATIAGKLLRKRVIWTDHADLKHIWKNIRVWYKNPIGKLVYLSGLAADKIVAISRGEIDLIKTNLKTNSKIVDKIKLIYNGSHDKRSGYADIKKNKKFTYLYAGRIVTDKGIGELIDAFTELAKTVSGVQLQIVGSGPELDKFRKLAKNNKNIYFLGHKADPIGLMAKADVFVYPSHHEAFGISIVEATMLGVPVVATSVGGIPEIISDGVSGLLVKPKDPNSLYEAMKTMYSSHSASELMAAKARKQFEECFDFDNIVTNQYIPLYRGRIK